MGVMPMIKRAHSRRLALWGVIALTLAVGAPHASSLSAAQHRPIGVGQSMPRQTAATVVAPQPEPNKVLLERYCITCHNERLRTANLTLDRTDLDRVGDHPEVWEKVVQKVRSGSMPPVGRPRPDSVSSANLVSFLETALDRAAARNPNPGGPAIHRLNRSEYVNAIRDMFDIEIDGRTSLPGDDSAYGFDNIADVLVMSQALLERYLSAAQKISRLAIGDPTMRPVVETYFTNTLGRQEEQESEDLPFGTRGGLAVRRYFPVDAEYAIKVRLKRTVDQENPIGLTERQTIEVRLDGVLLKQFPYGGPDSPVYSQYNPAPESVTTFELRVPIQSGTHVVGVTFHQNTFEVEGLAPRFPTSNVSFQDEDQPMARVERVEIGGPYHAARAEGSPSRRRIFVCRPTASHDEDACARRIISGVASRAFRRPVTDQDVRLILPFYNSARAAGTFDKGIQSALERILVSPQFLFRIEQESTDVQQGAAYRLGDIDVASRLSFFLWSSIPDDELVRLASDRELTRPDTLAKQTSRMLADRRSAALVTNFAGQWLYLRSLRELSPDTQAFPEFDDDLRVALERETELFVASQLREDRSVLDLLRADYTFVNERLARHYGIANVYGGHFRRVPVTGNSRPGGLLGHASILTATSYPNRTSPVERGKWMLENILGAPPPPPPPDVPALPEERGVTGRSMRERMEQHRRNAACAVCHARIDPLGFGLENFDAVGRWRSHEGSVPIDASGSLPDGSKFRGPAALRDLLVARPDEFVTTVVKQLLTYALGRGVEYYDMPAVRTILREAAAHDYRWSSIILGIVKSTPFQMRRSR
jgi:cytochrome c5